MDVLKNGVAIPNVNLVPDTEVEAQVEDVVSEEVTHFAEIMAVETIPAVQDTELEEPIPSHEKKLSDLSKDALFDKLNNYKKLLDNGLILQGEYDRLKNEILPLL